MNEITDAEANYIAALIDGEGNIVITKKPAKDYRRGYAFWSEVVITNTCEDVLKWVHGKIGVGHVYHHSKNKRFSAHKHIYKLRISSNLGKLLLQRIVKFLRVKNKQAQVIFKYYSLKRSNVGVSGYTDAEWQKLEDCYNEIALLNKKGVTRQDKELDNSSLKMVKACGLPQQLNENTSAYMAGIVDGEGCLQLYLR